jgi:molybdopterin-synthase adenylyltransferase
LAVQNPLRAVGATPSDDFASTMTDDQLLRYSRHIFLDDIGIEGQQKLLHAKVLIIGAGGLGSPVALYLASAGVGQLTVVDNDHVDATNLQRQIAHDMAHIGQHKATSIRDAVAAINPDVSVHAITERANAESLSALVQAADVVLDCTDNFDTRHAINQACVTHLKPLVSGAAIRFDGQVTVFDARQVDSPCYACLFPASASLDEERCATMGVFAPLVGIVGSVQAAEALKLICGIGQSLTGRLLMLDGRGMSWNEMKIGRDPSCVVCGSR